MSPETNQWSSLPDFSPPNYITSPESFPNDPDDVLSPDGEQNIEGPTKEELSDSELIDLENEPLNLQDTLVLSELADANDTVGLYLKEAGRLPLLNKEEEIALAKDIVAGHSARKKLGNKRLGRPYSEEKKAELQALIEAGWLAREHLIGSNVRLVISVAKKYMGRGVPFLDLIQEGNIGLMRSVKKFDYRRGHKFSTYATWWIRQAVTRAISDQGRTIRVPVHMGDNINKMYHEYHKLTQQLGRNPTVDELAEALETSTQKVENMIQVSLRPLSLQTPTDNDEDSVLGDFVEDENAHPDETAEYNLLREHLDSVLNTLPPREVKVLQLRYGLIDGQVYTLEEAGRKMGVTRERIRQIEAQALGRLKRSAIKRQLKEYLD